MKLGEEAVARSLGQYSLEKDNERGLAALVKLGEEEVARSTGQYSLEKD